VGFVACTDNEPEWQARTDRPGIFYVPIDADEELAQQLFETARQTKRKADIVAVSLHWGPNWGYKPPPAHVCFAYRLVQDGADIVFGHSAHVFQGHRGVSGKADHVLHRQLCGRLRGG
jgi:poly-gamma-glutamate capsule biosynthesis protein CapA/YwtB (metallophosphatase superfamily)